jgi:hypothetical protein
MWEIVSNFVSPRLKMKLPKYLLLLNCGALAY